MSDKFFVFGLNKRLVADNVVTIGEDSDFETLSEYLVKEKNFNYFDLCKNHLDEVYFEDSNTFISFSNNSPLQLRLQEPFIPNDSLVIVSKNKKDLTKIMENPYTLEAEDYKIFSGEKVKSSNIKEISFYMSTLMEVADEMLEAGYLEMENKKKISDWMITFQEPIMDVFIRYHRFTTSAKDFDTKEEFLINPQFRKVILISILKILANFIVSNQLLTKKDLKNLDSWESEKTWKFVKQQVKFY